MARELNTGSHAVSDIRCASCRTTLGWKYERAYVESQKYKEGKYIIELAHVVRENRHLELDRLLVDMKPSALNYIGESPGSYSTGGGGRSRSCSSSTETSTSDPRSPTSELDDLDDMFSFLDDVAGGRSSCQADLSLSFHSRNRRSLYSESAPYDWKYAGSPPKTGDNLIPNGDEQQAFGVSGVISTNQQDDIVLEAQPSEVQQQQLAEGGAWLSADDDQFYDCYSDQQVVFVP